MIFTPFGIKIEVSFVHPENVNSSILYILGMVIEEIL